MDQNDILMWYKILRIGILVFAIYGIIYYLWFTKKGKTMEEPAQRMLEENE